MKIKKYIRNYKTISSKTVILAVLGTIWILVDDFLSFAELLRGDDGLIKLLIVLILGNFASASVMLIIVPVVRTPGALRYRGISRSVI